MQGKGLCRDLASASVAGECRHRRRGVGRSDLRDGANAVLAIPIDRGGRHDLERFEHGAFDARLEFYHKQKLLLVENQRVLDKQTLGAAAGLRGQPMQATLLAFPCTEAHLEQVRNQLTKNGATMLTGATLIDGLLVVRALGNNSETLKQQLTDVWKTLRPELLGRPAVLPRIWAT